MHSGARVPAKVLSAMQMPEELDTMRESARLRFSANHMTRQGYANFTNKLTTAFKPKSVNSKSRLESARVFSITDSRTSSKLVVRGWARDYTT